MKRIVTRARAIFGAPFDPSYLAGMNTLQATAPENWRNTTPLSNPPMGFVAPGVEPTGNPGIPYSQMKGRGKLAASLARLVASLPGFGGIGPDPKSPDDFGPSGHRQYRRINDYSERYQNVTPNQALAAGGRAIIIKLPR